MKLKYRTIFFHVLAIILFLSLPILFSPELNTGFNIFKSAKFQKVFLSSFLIILFFYFNYYYLITKFYNSKKYFNYYCIIIVCLFVFIFFPEILIPNIPHNEFNNTPFNHPPPPKHIINIFNQRIVEFIGTIVFSLLLKTRETLKETEQKKTEAELAYLKAQINPHFLFNTLNGIYSLALTKSDKTPDAIIKLSEMMRYVLNDSNLKYVSLEKEKLYIINFIELQKLRLSPSIKFNYKWEGEIENKNIAPLILIPFIENAFKHGVNNEVDSEISITIEIVDNYVLLEVKNNIVPINNNTLNKSGLGIINTKDRLNLLYPNKHELTISETSTLFNVKLKLNIL